MKAKIKNILKDTDKKELLAKGGSFLIIRMLGLLAGYLFAFFVARFYGAGVYGLVSLSFSLFIVSGIIGRLGLDVNLVKYYSAEENWSDQGLFFRALLKSVLMACLIGLLLYFARTPISKGLFSKPQLEPYFLWIAAALPFWTATLLCGGVLRARKKNRWFAFLNNPGRFLFSFLILLLFWASIDNPLNAIKAHFFAIVILSGIAIFAVLKMLRRITFRARKNSWGFLKEAFPMMLSSTILVLLGWLDTFVLGIYETDQTIGIYNVALKIATLTSFSLQAINSILAPKLAANYSKGEDGPFRNLVAFSTKLNFFITLGVVAGILLFHRWLLSLFGEVFVAGSTILIILCVGQLINSMSGSVGVILQMTGHQKVHQNLVLIALGINLVLNFLLTPRFGGLGAAIATAVSILSWNVLGAWYLKTKLNIRSYYNFK